VGADMHRDILVCFLRVRRDLDSEHLVHNHARVCPEQNAR
jgi:hypothetical protein